MRENELPEWFAKVMGEQLQQAMRAQLAPLLQQIQQTQAPLAEYFRDSLAGPLRAYANEMSPALQAGIAQLVVALGQEGGSQLVIAEGGVKLPALGISAQGEVVTTTEDEAVAAQDESDSDRSATVDPFLFALILLWLVALAMPAAQAVLPSVVQAMLSNYYATIGLTLTIMWRLNDKRKR